MGGDATVNNAGALTIGTGAITSTKLANGSVSGGTGGTITDASITAADLAVASVDLAATDVTGILPITQGGTGAITAPAALAALGGMSNALTSANIFV